MGHLAVSHFWGSLHGTWGTQDLWSIFWETADLSTPLRSGRDDKVMERLEADGQQFLNDFRESAVERSAVSHIWRKGAPDMGYPATAARYAALDVQVLYVERVFFDELPPRFNVLAHQRGEDCLGGEHIFKLHLEQRAPFGIHGGLP